MIGYYIHHQGSGHMRTALQVLPLFSGSVVAMSSLPKPEDFPINVPYVQLIDDTVSGYMQSPDSAFMYTPHAPNVTERFKQILDAIRQYGITTMYVDVSMEVAIFCKTLGLRVGHNVLLGDRNDKPHSLLFNVCDFYLTDNDPRLYASSEITRPHNLQYVGGISRYKRRTVSQDKNIRNILITTSPKSDAAIAEGLRESAKAFPRISWHVIGPQLNNFTESNIVIHGVVDDPESLYVNADIVVGAGGHNTIMEAAALGKRFICIPEERPYREQKAAAEALAARNMALHRKRFPTASEWTEIFKAFDDVNVAEFQSIVDDSAAQNLAAVISYFD